MKETFCLYILINLRICFIKSEKGDREGDKEGDREPSPSLSPLLDDCFYSRS